jgi:hypothetical protein
MTVKLLKAVDPARSGPAIACHPADEDKRRIFAAERRAFAGEHH